ncbi:glycosyltransferase, partial [Empedobacter sp.]|uniref:glycosyltransferase family 2 protein n=1 Tax=Empedobacter sp. TaxID=1927715 RepID=UPI0028AC087C
MNEIKISICISVHNTGKYLRRCLDSVVEQTIREKEIILVNNGSTDDSLEIMKNYRQKFPHLIRIINQEDKGLAQGRQTGVNNAKGEY